MSGRQHRDVERIDYAVLHRTGQKTPFNTIREDPGDSDGSSEDSQSGSDDSADRTLVFDETGIEFVRFVR